MTVQGATCIRKSAVPPAVPACRLRAASAGFTYIALLTAIAIMGILLGAAGKYWSAVMARENETELLYRGDQYRAAIERYYTALPGRQQLPLNIEDLLKDDRFPVARRHLRHRYKDPITGEDFELITDKLKGNRMVGVRSASDKQPIRQKNFPDLYREFEGKEKYSEWEFKYTPPAPPAPPPPRHRAAPQQPQGLPPGHHLLPGYRPGQPLLPGQRPGQPYVPGQQQGQPYVPGQQPGQPYVPGQQPGQPYVPGHPQPGQPQLPGRGW